jgi:hypothetical protein
VDKNKLLLNDPKGSLMWSIPGEQAFEDEVMGFLKLCL